MSCLVGLWVLSVRRSRWGGEGCAGVVEFLVSCAVLRVRLHLAMIGRTWELVLLLSLRGTYFSLRLGQLGCLKAVSWLASSCSSSNFIVIVIERARVLGAVV